jgi:hypothetical protein
VKRVIIFVDENVGKKQTCKMWYNGYVSSRRSAGDQQAPWWMKRVNSSSENKPKKRSTYHQVGEDQLHNMVKRITSNVAQFEKNGWSKGRSFLMIW